MHVYVCVWVKCKKKCEKKKGGGGQKFLKKRCKIIFEQPLTELARH